MINELIINEMTNELKITKKQVEVVLKLLSEGNTIPFIARYRKEMHGSCDDQVLREVADRLSYLRNLEKRKEEVAKSITEQEKMTDEIMLSLSAAKTLTEVEDIYRPYKPKRKTRASVAIAKGLEPLANILQMQQIDKDFAEYAKDFVDAEKGVETVEAAIAGAKDILAERMSDDAQLRKKMRVEIMNTALFEISFDETCENSKTYESYKDYKENIKNMPSHRILAINRGEREKVLKVKLVFEKEQGLRLMADEYLKDNAFTSSLIKEVMEDSFSRLLMPSLETETRNELTDRANEQAIKMFELNLKPLLMQAPLKNNVILGLDPAYRTGCKIAIINKNGDVLDTTVIYPTPPQNKVHESIEKLKPLILKHNVDIVSIGNGTATKEAEIFVCELIKAIPERKLNYAVVNEAGASVYSASKLGAEEFPDFDVSLRSAVSIARRLQDPLAELIKIDVKSIGVGQYQHDMPQARLGEVLEGVVEDCVNSVGVDLNTASASLLSYVSGVGKSVAKNICAYRSKIKQFSNRQQLLCVPKLGEKAFEQCAGFLRVVGGEEILDNTSVHPESYDAARKLLKLFNLSQEDVKQGKLTALPLLIKQKGLANVAGIVGVGQPTLEDIVAELVKPGRDIRESMPQPVLRSDILSLKDLTEGMVLTGVVRNVIDFGAFVDIGVHQDGLVHISQICDKYIKHPSQVLTVGQKVQVKVLSVDPVKNRISLTMKF